MNRLLGVLVAFALVFAAAESAEAQIYRVYYPAVTTAYYQPAYYQPAPVTAYYAPAPRTVYYAPPVTYYRPLIGGTISGWRYNYPATTYVYPATTVAYYPVW